MTKPYFYIGPMDLTKMDLVHAKGYAAWKNQKTRCYNKKVAGYATYGSRGIRVLYSSRDFVSWYVSNHPSTKEATRWEVGRINHDDHYRFGNIEFVTKSENSREMILRTGNIPNQNRKKPVMAYKNGVLIGSFESQGVAAINLGLRQEAISRAVRGVLLHTGGYTFKYTE